MAGIIDTLIEEIHEWVVDNVDISPDTKIKNWGYVELTNRESRGKGDRTSTQPIPMTINGTADREQVALDDRYDFISWIRWAEPMTSALSEEDSWGLREGKRFTLPLRMVVAHKVELGETIILELAAGIPMNISVPGFDFVFITSNVNVDPNHEEIYRTELGNTVYERHRFNWNIYVLNINVEFVRCPPVEGVEQGKIFDFTFDFSFE